MKLELSFRPDSRRVWTTYECDPCTVHVTGWADTGADVVSGDRFARSVWNSITGRSDFADLMRGLNGNFVVVISNSDTIAFGVDAVRTIPLLYRRDGNTVLVSDSVDELRRTNDPPDDDSAVEFYMAGMATGPYTLFRDIRALQAGECIVCDRSEGTLLPERYYRYLSTYDAPESVEQLVEELDALALTVFERVVESLSGRQVVIPLSGGLDSRLVAATFKRLGYDRVVCFSYGRPGNWESERSKAIADLLGFPWHMFPYTGALWREIIDSDEVMRYWAFAGNAVSAPGWDDWPAVRALRENPAIDEDAVIINGNSGDYIVGSHLKYLLDPSWNDDPTDVHTAIIKKHCTLWFGLIDRPGVRDVIVRRIDEALEGLPVDTDEEWACRYEYWEWQERQAKIPVNMVRTYDFFGYDWRMPLWDLELMKFWERIPSAYKVDKYLYRKQLSTVDPYGLFQEDAPLSPWSRDRALEQCTRGTRAAMLSSLSTAPLVGSFLTRLRHYRRLDHMYRAHAAGMCRGYGWMRFVFRDPFKRHELAWQARDYMRMLGVEPPPFVRN